jgi:hypothetical protein
MRTRNEIEHGGVRTDILSLEVLLDIRELLQVKDSVKKVNQGKIHECDICHKTFDYALALAGHKRSHK